MYDFKMKNFDWNLIADVETDKKYRGKGLGSKLVDSVIKDQQKKGLYLFVKTDNEPAINLYKKMKFETLKTYNLKDGKYYIMFRGNNLKI